MPCSRHVGFALCLGLRGGREGGAAGGGSGRSREAGGRSREGGVREGRLFFIANGTNGRDGKAAKAFFPVSLRNCNCFSRLILAAAMFLDSTVESSDHTIPRIWHRRATILSCATVYLESNAYSVYVCHNLIVRDAELLARAD